MKQTKIVSLLALVGTAIMLTSIGAAQSGASVTAGDGENGTESTSSTLSTDAGNVTNANVTVTSVTDKWAAYYGQLNGEEILADAGNNNFYKWTVSDPSGSNVFAVPSGNPSPSEGSLATVSDPNSFLGPEYNTGVDQANDTFNTTDTVAGSTSTAVAETFVSGTPGTGFTSALYDDGNSNPVYAAEVGNDATGFDGNSYDYQLLVGVGESPSSQSFDFYASLN